MERNKTLETRSIDVAAAIQTTTGVAPTIILPGGSKLATFRFPATVAVKDALVRFETGLVAEAKLLLTLRSHLFRRLREGRQWEK